MTCMFLMFSRASVKVQFERRSQHHLATISHLGKSFGQDEASRFVLYLVKEVDFVLENITVHCSISGGLSIPIAEHISAIGYHHFFWLLVKRALLAADLLK